MSPDLKYWRNVAVALVIVNVALAGVQGLGLLDTWPWFLRVVLYCASGALASELADMWGKRQGRSEEEDETPP